MNGKVSSKISYGAINLLSNENKVLAESGAFSVNSTNYFLKGTLDRTQQAIFTEQRDWFAMKLVV